MTTSNECKHECLLPKGTSNNHYREFLMQKGGYDGFFEHEHGFILYKLFPESRELRIGELYVDKNYRQSGIGKELADKCTELALSHGFNLLSCMTHITGNDDALSMLAILHYGFKPIKAQADDIIFLKEI